MYGNTGNSSDKYDVKVKCAQEYVLPECSFEKEGYEFSYWKYSGSKYYPGDTLTIPPLLQGEKIVVTAVWKKVQ
jgi:hypothetical protein